MAVLWADIAEPCSNHDLGPWPLQPGPLAGKVPIRVPVHITKQQQDVSKMTHDGINIACRCKGHTVKTAKEAQSTVK